MVNVLAAALGALAAAAALLPIVLHHRRRRLAAEATARRVEAEATTAREALASVPDGLYLWDRVVGTEHCSGRLAALLGLPKGTASRLPDILDRLDARAAAALTEAVADLGRGRRAFDLALALADGARMVQAVGRRVAARDGSALVDVLWIREAAETARRERDEAADGDAIRELLDAAPFPVWFRDTGLEPAFANRAAEAIVPSNAARALAERALAEGRALTETHAVPISGQERRCEITEVPLGDGTHTIGFAIVRGDDGEAALSRVLETLATGVAVYGCDGRLGFFNPAFARLWRLDGAWLAAAPTLGEVLERLRSARRLPEVADFRTFREEQLGLFGSLTAARESLLHLPDGATFRTVVAPHAEGGLIFTYEDVTDRLALERSLKTLSAVQRETLDNLHEGVAVFGADGRLKLSNPIFAKLWGLAATEADASLHVSDLVERMRPLLTEAGDWDARRDAIISRLMGREARAGRLVRRDGSVLEYADVPLPDGAMLLSYLDVTDGARVEMALRQRAEALQEANRLKSEFIANVSFEVRTPLNAILGFAEVLSGEYFGKLNARQTDYARGILDGAQTLTTVVHDILDLAAIEAGMMTLELDTVELHGALVAVLGLVRERARRKGLEMTFDCAPDIGWLVADEKRLKQVVFNLLSNAIAFTPPRGRVRLGAHRDGGEVTIEVTDTGIGIAPADHERVFQPFEHRPAPDGGGSGAGLGLTLVKRFVELHGGRVEMRSSPRKGTTVRCVLPAVGATAARPLDRSLTGS